MSRKLWIQQQARRLALAIGQRQFDTPIFRMRPSVVRWNQRVVLAETLGGQPFGGYALSDEVYLAN
ncbi:MAG: hypothetical protein ACR2HF_09340 [Methylococcaceae bacterium]